MFENRKQILVILHDLAMAALAWQAGWWLRFNLDVPEYYVLMSLYTMPLVLLIQGLVYIRFRIHRGLWRYASLQDVWNIFRAAIFGALCVTLVLFIWNRLEGMPRSILIQYPVFLMLLLSGPRLAYRFSKEHALNVKAVTGNKRVLIVGAGNAGEMLARDMLRAGSHVPVGFIDDDPVLRNAEIHGVKVRGAVADITNICQQFHVDIIVIAVPSATSEQMQKIVTTCEHTGCVLRTLPKLQDMVSGKATLNELRAVQIEDLLGREKIELDWPAISSGLSGKTVLVSGGGGSIGAELCRQIAGLGPGTLILIERNELNLYNVDRTISAEFPSIKYQSILGDLCDQPQVNYVLARYRPEVIFHAAAYKHVPILEHQVREAVRNNILATKNLAEAAVRHGCRKFVFISTDKAVNPANVLGASKRIAEMYCDWKNRQSGATAFITVRFGNVLGSDGSVVPLFREQIRKGGPVTITHPDITRYFMTIPEACQLIMQAAVMGEGGEIFVLDMGEPVRIAFLADQMIRLSGRVPGKDVEVIYTGLRAGEKLYEELFYENETSNRTSHPKIMLAHHAESGGDNLAARISELEYACSVFDEVAIKTIMQQLVPLCAPAAAHDDNTIPVKSVRS